MLAGQTQAKSSLFNALLDEDVSVVADKENLTRDVVKRSCGDVVLYDTPGVCSVKDLAKVEHILSQINIVCIVSSIQEGVDKLYFDLIKKYATHAEICFVHTKKDLPHSDINEISDVKSFAVSIYDKKSLNVLKNWLFQADKIKVNQQDIDVKLHIFGRSNVGKSTIANALLEQNRFLVADEIGTTIEVNQEIIKRYALNIAIYDTPGFRKNKHLDGIDAMVQDRIENCCAQKWHADQFCCVVLNAEDGVTTADKKILDTVSNSFILLIVINKKDLISDVLLRDMQKMTRQTYKIFDVIAISSLNSRDIMKLRGILRNMLKKSHEIKISTSHLNKWMHALNMKFLKYIVYIEGVNFKIFYEKNPRAK